MLFTLLKLLFFLLFVRMQNENRNHAISRLNMKKKWMHVKQMQEQKQRQFNKESNKIE